MGLLDRFKKPPGPDALTWEAVARARAVPGVAGAEAIDADTVAVTWTTHPGTSTLSLADIREVWAKASGFDRIELMDGVMDGLAPPAPGPEPAAPVGDPVPAPESEPSAPPAEAVPPVPPPSAGEGEDWASVRDRIAVRVGRPGEGAVRWRVVPGIEARATLDHPGGRAVSDADLAAWRVEADAVRQAALANLEAADPELDPIGPDQPAWVPTVPGDHPPVWLAAPGRLLAAIGLAEAVALAPTPTELVVADPAAHELVATILAGTRSIVADAAEVLLAAPLLVTSTGIEHWQPPAGHPCAALVEELRNM